MAFTIGAFVRDVTAQNFDELYRHFLPSAVVYRRNTDETFTAEQYARVNCDYPGVWRGEVERVETFGDVTAAVYSVWTDGAAFRCVSFFEVRQGKIVKLDEYWGDITEPPEWRKFVMENIEI